jgi:hypothetical protein
MHRGVFNPAGEQIANTSLSVLSGGPGGMAVDASESDDMVLHIHDQYDGVVNSTIIHPLVRAGPFPRHDSQCHGGRGAIGNPQRRLPPAVRDVPGRP